jgi:RND superfamily putative drug exporter
VSFSLAGTQEQTETRIDAALAATAAVQRAHPQVRVEQAGGASIDKGLSKSFEDDFRQAELLSLPVTLIVLVLAFGALVAAGLPLLLGLTAVAASLGLVAPISQLFRSRSRSPRSSCSSAGRRRGLRDVLPAPRREERAAGAAPEAPSRRPRPRPARRPRLRLHGHGRDGGMFFAGSPVFTSFAWGRCSSSPSR